MDTANQPSLDQPFYVVIDGEQKGPFSLEELRALQASGSVDKQTLYWQEGMADWVPLGQSVAFQNSEKPRIPVPPVGGLSSTHYRSEKIGFILLAIPVIAMLVWWAFSNSTGWPLDSAKAGLFLIALGGFTNLVAAILVGIESSRLGMGAENDRTPKGKRRLRPRDWVANVFLFGPLAGPCYFFQRRRYGARNLLVPALIMELVCFAIFCIPTASTPFVNNPEVIATAEKVIHQNPVMQLAFSEKGPIEIKDPVEIAFNRKEKKRIARAFLQSSDGNEGVIYYSVQVHNANDGTFIVRVSANKDQL